MPNLNYSYMPVYGVEPYLDNNGAGGAKVTQENLIITAWAVESKFEGPPEYIEFEGILKPAEVNTALPEAARIAGKQTFDSRHSALVYINGNLNQEGGEELDAVGYVLNPPPEMKQLLQGAVEYNGGAVDSLDSYTVKKSLQSAYAWRQSFFAAEYHNALISTEFPAVFSTYLFFSEPFGDETFRIPFLKTNGADGVTPKCFDVSMASGVRQMIEAVNDGDFYVVYILPVLSEYSDASYSGIVYPHSAARG